MFAGKKFIKFLNKLLFLNLEISQLAKFKREIGNEQVSYPTYKELFDLLKNIMHEELITLETRIGFRFGCNLEKNENLDLFIAHPNLVELSNKFQNFPSKNIIKNVSIIEVELVKEGLIRCTFVPFDPRKNELFEGPIYNIKDYVEYDAIKKNELKEHLRPFIQIPNKITLLKNNHLYKPIDYENLREKNNSFEEYEVIYLHQWDRL